MTADVPVAAIGACRAVARSRGTSFYAGMRLCPEPARSGMFALYAWNRVGDDIADGDGSSESRLSELAGFAAETCDALGGRVSEGSSQRDLFEAVAWCAGRFGLEAAWFEGMLRGLEGDARERLGEGFADRDELRAYCDDVAGTVGRMCVAMWGVREGASLDEALRLASVQGYAFQLTNILRDVAEDAGRSPARLYLDRETLARCGMDAEAFQASVRRGETGGAVERVVLEMAAEARAAFEEVEGVDGRGGLARLIHPSCGASWWAMTRVYRGILDRIEREPRAVAQRVRLSKGAKLAIALGATSRRVLGVV